MATKLPENYKVTDLGYNKLLFKEDAFYDTQTGEDYLSSVASSHISGGTMSFGNHDDVMKFTEQGGLHLGDRDFDNAPFSVDMQGNVNLTGSVTISLSASDISDVDAYATGQDEQSLSTLNYDSPSGSGLYMDSTHLGYYSGSAWTAYIDSSGNFKFYGDASNYVEWNGTTLTVRGSFNADDITAGGTITGNTLRTDAAGSNRVEIRETGEGTSPNEIVFMNSSNIILAALSCAFGAATTYFDIDAPTRFTDGSVIATIEAGGLQMFAKIAPNSSNSYDLGTSSLKWQDIYLAGNVYVDGNVDGVDISSHAASSSAHHTKYSDSDARSAVTGTALPGDLLSGSSTYDLGSSTYPWDNVYCADIYDQSGSRKIDVDGYDNAIDFHGPIELWQNSGTPGTASSSYEGFMYYDTGQDDIVFCAYESGTSSYKWYKVSATAI